MNHNKYPPYNSFFTAIAVSRFDYDGQKIQFFRKDNILYRICAYINIFCGLKAAVILLAPNVRTIYYLVELYIIESLAQKSFQAGLMGLHFSTGMLGGSLKLTNFPT